MVRIGAERPGYVAGSTIDTEVAVTLLE